NSASFSFRQARLSKKLVVRGNDVLDRRAVLRLLKTERVDQNLAIGDSNRDSFELGELTTGGCDLLEYPGGVESPGIKLGKKRNTSVASHDTVHVYRNSGDLYTSNGTFIESRPNCRVAPTGHSDLSQEGTDR